MCQCNKHGIPILRGKRTTNFAEVELERRRKKYIRNRSKMLVDRGDIPWPDICPRCQEVATPTNPMTKHHYDYRDARHFVFRCRRCHDLEERTPPSERQKEVPPWAQHT